MTSLSPLLKQATPVVVDSARGCWISGTDGRDHLEFTTGIGVTSMGHCHPRVVEAAREQVGRVIHAQCTTVMHPPLLELAEKLGEVLPPGLDSVFYAPTVLSGVSPDAALMSQEIFGPVAPVVPLDSEEQVLRWANDTPWGLVGYLFTRDVDRSFRVSEALEVGMVGVNTGLVSDPAAPFGGIKASGLGREGGRVGIEEFLETKYTAVPRGR